MIILSQIIEFCAVDKMSCIGTNCLGLKKGVGVGSERPVTCY